MMGNMSVTSKYDCFSDIRYQTFPVDCLCYIFLAYCLYRAAFQAFADFFNVSNVHRFPVKCTTVFARVSCT